tara:strand:+ start:586 stop:1626 length:1041 start_codon:yes stop_codon:yes gene_type:complete
MDKQDILSHGSLGSRVRAGSRIAFNGLALSAAVLALASCASYQKGELAQRQDDKQSPLQVCFDELDKRHPNVTDGPTIDEVFSDTEKPSYSGVWDIFEGLGWELLTGNRHYHLKTRTDPGTLKQILDRTQYRRGLLECVKNIIQQNQEIRDLAASQLETITERSAAACGEVNIAEAEKRLDTPVKGIVYELGLSGGSHSFDPLVFRNPSDVPTFKTLKEYLKKEAEEALRVNVKDYFETECLTPNSVEVTVGSNKTAVSIGYSGNNRLHEYNKKISIPFKRIHDAMVDLTTSYSKQGSPLDEAQLKKIGGNNLQINQKVGKGFYGIVIEPNELPGYKFKFRYQPKK